MDFEFDAPKPTDFHAIKNLLASSGNNFNCSGIADAVLEQDGITRVVRVADDEELFGFISVLNFFLLVHHWYTWVCTINVWNYSCKSQGIQMTHVIYDLLISWIHIISIVWYLNQKVMELKVFWIKSL